MERSVHDALCVVKRVLESQQVVAGGGAVEVALSVFLENFATSIVRLPFDYLFFGWFWACDVVGIIWSWWASIRIHWADHAPL